LHKTSAWPLSLVYVGLVVYASLYPFADWRYQGIVPWAFLGSPLPRYWSGFDVVINVLGYMPLGFLLALGALRSGKYRFATLTATLAAAALSLLMESLQSYLPARVPSQVDLALNLTGAWLGAVMAGLLERLGVIDHWSRFRARWFVPDARGALVLLSLWPLALLFPAAVPFGLGQVSERIEATLGDWLEDSPWLYWLPVREVELQPLAPGAELVCVALGLLLPCLLAYSIIRAPARRALFALLALGTGVVATALSAALSYGPEHLWAWVSLPGRVGLGLAALMALVLLWVPTRAASTLLLLALAIDLSLINQAPTGPYLAQTLATWEQGRFIRFNGLALWLGWLWPYAALVYVLTRLWRPGQKN